MLQPVDKPEFFVIKLEGFYVLIREAVLTPQSRHLEALSSANNE